MVIYKYILVALSMLCARFTIAFQRKLNQYSLGSISKLSIKMRKLNEIATEENTFQKYLKAEPTEMKDGSKINPRQVKNAHFTNVLPEKVPRPELIAVSESCMKSLQIDPSEMDTEDFLLCFSGNELIPGMEMPYCTVYGTHSYGTWFGQMGDGRAVYLGETFALDEKDDNKQYPILGLRELQLKGSGRSPFSRGFDGRAVLRSSIREFLVSELMYHLRVPTTRALTLIGTGQTIRRPWYASTSQSNPYQSIANGSKFPPDTMRVEPGAILCRVSRSFLRFGHLEILGHRKEWDELRMMMDYVCLREYPHLLEAYPATSTSSVTSTTSPNDQEQSLHLVSQLSLGPAQRYIQVYREIVDKVAYLVSQWLRVGYVQGNMNSDNTLVSGRTMDYGPFGWMERFHPYYQPFTSDSTGHFSYLQQPQAMCINIQVLAETAFQPFIQHFFADDPQLYTYLAEIESISKSYYLQQFERYYQEVKRTKLGLQQYQSEDDNRLYDDLLPLLYQ
jgi:serine/tyrosine/threonine adenylyltransferase